MNKSSEKPGNKQGRWNGLNSGFFRSRAVPKAQDGPHWRPSVNKLVGSEDPQGSHIQRLKTCHSSPSQISQLVNLPAELRHNIEGHLFRSDIVCFRQTCRRLRLEAQETLGVQDLNVKQLHVIRKRFDRDSFAVLRRLDEKGLLSKKLAVCNFCMSVHGVSMFSEGADRLHAHSKACGRSWKEYTFCGHFRDTPHILRQALEDTLASGREQFPIHHWMPRRLPDSNRSMLSSTIEEGFGLVHVPPEHSSFFVDDTGLVLQHNFQLQTRDSMLASGWNFAAALASPRKSILSICPHLTVHTAGGKLSRGHASMNKYLGACNVRGCRTIYGWFEGPGKSLGSRSLCLRVERRFGWIENLTDEFWRSQ